LAGKFQVVEINQAISQNEEGNRKAIGLSSRLHLTFESRMCDNYPEKKHLTMDTIENYLVSDKPVRFFSEVIPVVN
jgi:hypothetical protein